MIKYQILEKNRLVIVVAKDREFNTVKIPMLVTGERCECHDQYIVFSSCTICGKLIEGCKHSIRSHMVVCLARRNKKSNIPYIKEQPRENTPIMKVTTSHTKMTVFLKKGVKVGVLNNPPIDISKVVIPYCQNIKISRNEELRVINSA